MRNNPWTADAIETLRAMAADGRSPRDIATALGDDFTRNAVLGKAHRLGLSLASQDTRSPAPAPEPAPIPSPAVGDFTITDLTEFACHWPLGDPYSGSFRYCGAVKQFGRPYCDAHAAVARGVQPRAKSKPRSSFTGKLKLSGAYT